MGMPLDEIQFRVEADPKTQQVTVRFPEAITGFSLGLLGMMRLVSELHEALRVATGHHREAGADRFPPGSRVVSRLDETTTSDDPEFRTIPAARPGSVMRLPPSAVLAIGPLLRGVVPVVFDGHPMDVLSFVEWDHLEVWTGDPQPGERVRMKKSARFPLGVGPKSLLDSIGSVDLPAGTLVEIAPAYHQRAICNELPCAVAVTRPDENLPQKIYVTNFGWLERLDEAGDFS
jgi:hypothetical protein